MVQNYRSRKNAWTACWVLLLLVATQGASYAYTRVNKMFDVPQDKRPEWGDNWCVPTAVGNSFAWLAKEFPALEPLMKVNGTGGALSAEDVINILGVVDMGTDPNAGTPRSVVEQAKKDYIERHGLQDKITVEAQVAIPKAKPDGSFDGWDGTRVTKEWLKEQYKKGQDVEFAVSYYEKRPDGKWYRTGGHVEVYDGDVPGLGAGGHQMSLANILDPSPSNPYSDFVISFTDPGRDDLTGQFGAIASDVYSLVDYSGTSWINTESTYNVYYEPDPFGIGYDALLLDGYQGAGDFLTDGAARDKLTVLEAGWAESPVPGLVPEPQTILLALAGMLGTTRRKRWMAA